MKTMIYTVLLCLPCIAFSQTNITYLNANFNGMHCRGDRGICSAENVENRAQSNAFIEQLKDGSKVLKIFKEKVSLDKIASPFLKENTNNYSLEFVVEEEKTLSKNNKIAFKKGSYLIEITNDYYIINLK